MIQGKVWVYILVGIYIGAFIHGYMPACLLAGLLGKETRHSVPLAVLVNIPLYSNAAGVMPCWAKVQLGSTFGFMMSVIGLSLPEVVILCKVMRPRLIAAFVGIVALGIILADYL